MSTEKTETSGERTSRLQVVKDLMFQSTETLWQNEINANLYVAKVMLITAAMCLLVLLLNMFGVFSISNSVMMPTLSLAFLALAAPAALCLALKGERKWLKILLMGSYTIVMSAIIMVLGHNVTLCAVFPVVLSIRYYSSWVTANVAIMTFLLSGVAEYFGVARQFGRIDLNMVELPAGTTMTMPDYTVLRDAVPIDVIDFDRLWLHTLQHSFMPKLILFVLVALICVKIAARGRQAIFAQKAETEKVERLATELNLASEIQLNTLPNIFPVYPDRKEFTLHASMTPAKEVGGDFYDFFLIDENHVGLVMADVSGKGIPAALFMMVSRTLIKNRAMLGGTPAQILNDVNAQLCEGNSANLFVTVWLAILDVSTGKGVAANAGHEHPVLRRGDEEFCLVTYRHSPVVGTFEGMTFKEHEFHLDPGDTLFVYTDGVAEANNADSELFGTDRLLDALNVEPNARPEQLIENVHKGIDAFVDGAEQFDDITMLCLKYFGPQE